MPDATDNDSTQPSTPPATPETLPTLRTGMDDDAIVSELMALAKRGRLAGYRPGPEPGALFLVDAHGTPWDRDLLASVDGSTDGSRVITFRLRARPKMPAVFALALAFTVWPGVVLTDSLLATWFGFYNDWSVRMPWLTYAWYLPLTVIPLPWIWRGWARSTRATTLEHAHEQVAKIAAALDAETG